jgi:hypothetical protein
VDRSVPCTVLELIRGQNQGQQVIFTRVTPADVVPVDHPIRKIKGLADQELRALSPVVPRLNAS